jgi:RND family efflux transporter MFP subunit
MNKIFFLALVTIIVACSDKSSDLTEATRGLRAFKVENSTRSVERRYSSVVQPHDETRLAFEVGGQLQKVDLDEGQTVRLGEVLLKLDSNTFQLHVQASEAELAQTTAAYRNASANFERQSVLWDKRVIPRSGFDDAKAAVDTARAQQKQASKRLEIAQDNLAKTQLKAPFQGTITKIEVSSYATIPAGQRTLTLYADNAFETAFTVPSSVISALTVGQPVRILISDMPSDEYSGHISELGARAAEVSAFPVVVVLDNAPANLKSGMSAEVIIDIALEQHGDGFLIPITCFSFNTVKQLNPDRTGVPVFVYDPDTGTVRERKVDVLSVRENMVIVQSGLQIGDLVASAGVSYLRDGQPVQLLEQQ